MTLFDVFYDDPKNHASKSKVLLHFLFAFCGFNLFYLSLISFGFLSVSTVNATKYIACPVLLCFRFRCHICFFFSFPVLFMIHRLLDLLVVPILEEQQCSIRHNAIWQFSSLWIRNGWTESPGRSLWGRRSECRSASNGRRPPARIHRHP